PGLFLKSRSGQDEFNSPWGCWLKPRRSHQNNWPMNVVDRQIRDIQREEEDVKRSVKDAAKKGQKDVCTALARAMIRSGTAMNKLYASKAHMNSVLMGMRNQLVVLRVAGSLQKSTEVMRAVQSLVKIPEIQATMRELSKEMLKAGITEMLEDTFESMDDQEEMEEEAEMEIDKILFEITAGALGKAPGKVTDALPEPEPSGAMAASEDEKEEEALEAMRSRLATLHSEGRPTCWVCTRSSEELPFHVFLASHLCCEDYHVGEGSVCLFSLSAQVLGLKSGCS
uniref:Charged multivesicular body protein 3 n=1 Tax=Cebus imitator TaxID=2715852 RepID=A0A2K5SIH1_CEBIM